MTTLKCDSCEHYVNPIRKELYPNTDNEAVGWVKCGVGNIVKRGTMACHRHPMAEVKCKPERAAWSTPKTTIERANDAPDNTLPAKPIVTEMKLKKDLLGGKDFGASLLNDINNLLARA